MRRIVPYVLAVVGLFGAASGCAGKRAQCKTLGTAIAEGGQEVATKVVGKSETDPTLATLLDDYAKRLDAVDVSNKTLAGKRDEYASSLRAQAKQTRSWQAATTPEAKATAMAEIAATQANQERLGSELVAACK